MRIASGVLLVCLNAFGQSFEVASIKVHPEPVQVSMDARVSGTLVRATAVTLLDLIEDAYGVAYDQVSGVPGWGKTVHFDVEARAAGERALTTDQMREMLQNLLAERFQLVIHREMKEVPMWDLVVAKGGPKLKPFDPEKNLGGILAANGTMHMTVSKGTMEQLAVRLRGNGAARPVRDKTGLTGYYSYTLDWVNGIPAPDSDGVPLFEALPQQLGLRLESSKGVVEQIVVDRAERPSAN